MRAPRISVTHLRVLMILLNLGIAGGIAFYYFTSLVGGDSDPSVSSLPPPVDPQSFAVIDVVAGTTDQSLSLMASAATRLQPARPKVPEPSTADADAAGEDAAAAAEAEDILEGGPLAADWEYIGCIYNRESPLKSIVQLRRKPETPDDGGASTAGRGPSGSSARSTFSSQGARNTTRSSVSSRFTAGARGGRPATVADETLFLTLEQHRHCVDPEREIDVFLISVSPRELVYASGAEVGRGQPLKRYSLPRKYSTQFSQRAATQSLYVLGEPPPADGEGEDAEGEEKRIVLVPRNVEDLRASELEALLAGKSPKGDLVGSAPRTAGTGKRTLAGRSTSSSRQAATSSSAPGSRASQPYSDPRERAEAMRRLREETRNLPPEARRELEDGLSGQAPGAVAAPPPAENAPPTETPVEQPPPAAPATDGAAGETPAEG